MQIFEIFECSGQNSSNSSCQFWTDKSIPLQIWHHSSLTHNSPVNVKLIHFLLWIKGSHQSPNFGGSGEKLPNSSCHFWKLMSVFLQILHQFSVPSNVTSLCFVNSNIIYFGQIFEIFECLAQSSLKSSCQFWTDKSIPLEILHHSPVWKKVTPLYFFSLNIIYFGHNQPIKVKIFET